MGLWDAFKGKLRDAWNNPKCDPRRSRQAMKAILKRDVRPIGEARRQPAGRYVWNERRRSTPTPATRWDVDALIGMFQLWLDSTVLGSMQSYGQFRDESEKIVRQFLRSEIHDSQRPWIEDYYAELLQFLEDMDYYEDYFEEHGLLDDVEDTAA